jgi:hypothetical protein
MAMARKANSSPRGTCHAIVIFLEVPLWDLIIRTSRHYVWDREDDCSLAFPRITLKKLAQNQRAVLTKGLSFRGHHDNKGVIKTDS